MNLNDLRPDDFEACFANEPDIPTEPEADLARGHAALRRRRRVLLGAAAAGAAVVVLTAALLQPALRMSGDPAEPAEPVSTTQPTPADPPPNPGPSSSTSTPPFLGPPHQPSQPDPDPTGRSWLLPPDSNRRLFYANGVRSDPAPATATPTISKARALAIAAKGFDIVNTPGTDYDPAIALRLLSSGDDGPRLDEIGTKPRLVWVVLLRVDPRTVFLEPRGDLDQLNCWNQVYVHADTGRAPSVSEQCFPR